MDLHFNKACLAYILLCGISITPCLAQVMITTKQINRICLSLSDEVRRNTPTEKIDSAVPAPISDLSFNFVRYLHNAYYAKERKTRTATKTQLPQGTLLRLAEGKLIIEQVEDELLRVEPYTYPTEYMYPTEMVETEYFFLNNRLVKISVTIGHADYNVIPSNYWIIVSQIDFSYHKTEPSTKTIYNVSFPTSPESRRPYPPNAMTDEEWIQTVLSRTNTTEEQLKANAYLLYQLFTLNKELFNR